MRFENEIQNRIDDACIGHFCGIQWCPQWCPCPTGPPDFGPSRIRLVGLCTGPTSSAGRPVVSDFDWSPMIGDRTVKR